MRNPRRRHHTWLESAGLTKRPPPADASPELQPLLGTKGLASAVADTKAHGRPWPCNLPAALCTSMASSMSSLQSSAASNVSVLDAAEERPPSPAAAARSSASFNLKQWSTCAVTTATRMLPRSHSTEHELDGSLGAPTHPLTCCSAGSSLVAASHDALRLRAPPLSSHTASPSPLAPPS